LPIRKTVVFYRGEMAPVNSVTTTATETLRRQQRLIFRCVMAFLLDLASQMNRRHGGDFVQASVFLAVTQATRPVASGEGGALTVRGISVRAIAQSLLLPYESTRRKIGELEAAGLIQRVSDGGIVVAPGALRGETARADAEANWASLRRLIADLRDLRFDFNAFSEVSALPLRLDAEATDLVGIIAGPCADFVLRVLEMAAPVHGSLLDALVCTAIMTANADLLTHDAELAWKYGGAETPPPDELRRPVTIAALARRLNLPHESVRRRVNHFVALGWVKRVTGGYLYRIDRMQHAEVLDSGLVTSQRFLQLLQTLRQLGLNPATL
jgi:DNA-binding Lrp family transcriptional regulator